MKAESSTRDYADYMDRCRKDAHQGTTVDMCSVKAGDRVIRHTGDVVRVVESIPAYRALETWVLKYDDGTLSCAGFFYPQRLAS